MQVSVETISNLERRMTVAIPHEKVDSEIQARLKSLAGKAKLQGFRPGKVPMSVVKKRFGAQVQQEVMGELVQTTYYEALSQEQLIPAGMPQIEPGELKQGQDLEYVATFEIYPEVKLDALSSMAVEKNSCDIQDADVDKVMETIRKQRRTWETVERAAQDGDQVTVDFEGSIDGEVFAGGSGNDMPVELGSGRMIPGFEDGLKGASAGEEKSLNLNFPEEYHAKDVAGKPVVFKVTVKKVEEARLPEVDDEFAKAFGITEGGVEKLREQVRENMGREAEQKIKSLVKKSVMEQLVEKVVVETPKSLVDSEIAALMNQRKQAMGMKPEDTLPDVDASKFEDDAKRRVSLGLILQEIVKQNDLKAEPAKLRQTVEAIAAGYEYPEQVMQYYFSDKQRLAEIENLVLEDSAVDWILTQANVTEKPVSFDDLMNPTAAGAGV